MDGPARRAAKSQGVDHDTANHIPDPPLLPFVPPSAQRASSSTPGVTPTTSTGLAIAESAHTPATSYALPQRTQPIPLRCDLPDARVL